MKAYKKYSILGMILILCMSVLAGCMNSESDTPTVATTSNDATTDEVKTEVSPTEVIKQGTIEKEGNVILKELTFVYNDESIAINDAVDDEKLEKILGTAVEINSHTYTEDDGLNMDPLIGFTEKQYIYKGVEVKTIKSPNDENYYVFQILITDTAYATIRNIKVGDSVETLKSVYPEGNLSGNGAPNEEDDYRYLPVNYVDGMIFHIKDEKIESIQIYKLLD